MKTLEKPVSEIGFYEREQRGGEYVSNKCGRDFTYYALNHYDPERFNVQNLSPEEIDRQRLFGQPVPGFLAWTQIQFGKLPQFLHQEGYQLSINDQEITDFADFLKAILFSRKNIDSALSDIERCVDSNKACGVDISLGMGGLLDHVIFVYGYDDEYLYVVDTHKVPKLEYETVDNKYPFLLKISREIVAERWSTFGRVWTVTKSAT